MMIAIRFAITLIIGLGLAINVRAEQQSFPDIQRIIDNKKIVVSVLGHDVAPFIMTGKDGELFGFDINLARRIAARLGVKPEFVRTAKTYDSVVNLVAKKEADIAVSNLTRSIDRSRFVYFTKPYLVQAPVMIIHRVNWLRLKRKYSWIEKANDLAGLPAVVGADADGAYVDYMRRLFPSLKIMELATFDESAKAVMDGKITAAFHGETEVGYFFDKNPAASILLRIEKVQFVQDPIAIAVRPDAPNLVRWLNIFLDATVGTLTPQELVARFNADEAKRRQKE